MSEGQILEPDVRLSIDDLRDAWRVLDAQERVEGFRLLAHGEGEEFFCSLPCADQVQLVRDLTHAERRLWMRQLAPDDAADVIQQCADEQRGELMQLLDEPVRRELTTLLAYKEDVAGGLMNPRFARVRPEMAVDEAILYLRKQANEGLELYTYAYVLDKEQKLLGVVSFRDLFRAKASSPMRDVMKTDVITIPEEMDQEAVGRLFAEADRVALPVVDKNGRMQGIVTVDDIVDVVQEEATEDIQKIGGTSALDAPYLEVSFLGMLKKRIGWLTFLFFAQMLTVAAMGMFEEAIDLVPVLALFVPLIISSGGNSGSQASTLVIRAMSLGEVRLSDWKRVFFNELATGLTLGLTLGLIGLVRVLVMPPADNFEEHLPRLGLTILCSLTGIVLWGTLMGSMLPLLLRRVGLDPASACAPLVATLVDVTGLVLYFSVATFWLSELLASARP